MAFVGDLWRSAVICLAASGMVPGGGVVKKGWLINANDHWVWRFWRDKCAWVRDPKMFLDRGCLLSGEELLLKGGAMSPQGRRRAVVEGTVWKLLKKPAWGASAEV